MVALALVAAYLCGTIPSAIVVARSKGVDITTFGSGNPGATNVARALGRKWGAVVFLVDAAKGALPVLVTMGDRRLAYACGVAAVLGHVFPLTRRLKGGKGVATGAGVLLALQPGVFGVTLAAWALAVRTTKKVSVGSIAAVPVAVAGLAVAGAPAWEVLSVIAIGVLVEVRHIPNMRRLLARSEPPAPGPAS